MVNYNRVGMSELIYEYVKGQGWTLQSRRDPRTLWVSPDGKYAIAKTSDVPDGTPRTLSYSPAMRTMAVCIQLLEDNFNLKGLDSLKSSADVAKYVRTTLPWEST